MKNRRAFTIVEALTGIVLLSILLAAIYIFLSGHILQRRHLEGYIDLQRDTRLAILRLQRDLKSLIKITKAERGKNEQMKRFEFIIPVEDDVQAPVKYAFDLEKRGIRRNGRLVIEKTIKEMQIWLLDENGRDIFGSPTYEYVHAVRLRVKVTTPPQPGQKIPGPQGKEAEKLVARGRTLDFTIFPRVLVSAKKAREGRLNLNSGRFAVSGSGGRVVARPVVGP